MTQERKYLHMLSVNTISSREAAEYLGISFPYLHTLIQRGKITPIGTFGRNIILDRHQIVILKKEREEEGRQRNDRRLK